MGRVADDTDALFGALRRSPDESGPHAPWVRALMPALAGLEDDVAELHALLQSVTSIANDAADAEDEDEEADEDGEEGESP